MRTAANIRDCRTTGLHLRGRGQVDPEEQNFASSDEQRC
jgi:hypothetical protein